MSFVSHAQIFEDVIIWRALVLAERNMATGTKCAAAVRCAATAFILDALHRCLWNLRTRVAIAHIASRIGSVGTAS